ADAQTHDATERPPSAEAEVPDLEVAFLKILKWMLWPVVVAAGQMNLAILADDAAIGPDEDTTVVPMFDSSLDGEFGKAEVKADPEPGRFVEQRLCRRTGHFAL